MIRVFVSAAVVMAALAFFFLIRKGKKNGGDKESPDLKSETVESELSLDDVVAYFKSLNLDPKIHKPFIANGNSEKFQQIASFRFPNDKAGYSLLVFGVYDSKSDSITECRIVYAKSIDSKLIDILGDDHLVFVN